MVKIDGTYAGFYPGGGVVIFCCKNLVRVKVDGELRGSRVIFAVEVMAIGNN